MAASVAVEGPGVAELALTDVTAVRHRAGVCTHVLCHAAAVQTLVADRARSQVLVTVKQQCAGKQSHAAVDWG